MLEWEKRVCVANSPNRAWANKLHSHFLWQWRILSAPLQRLPKHMLQPLCFQTAFEQCINNRLVHLKLFCAGECKGIRLFAELPFQYSTGHCKTLNIPLLSDSMTHTPSWNRRQSLFPILFVLFFLYVYKHAHFFFMLCSWKHLIFKLGEESATTLHRVIES